MKTCSFLHATFTETMEVVENLFKKAYGEQFIMLQVHIGIAFLKHFQCVSAINVTENKENYLEIYTYQVSCLMSLPLLNITNGQNCIKTPVPLL